MKTYIRLLAALVCFALGQVSLCRAANHVTSYLFWDTDGVTAGGSSGTTANGTWGVDSFWSTSGAGTATTGPWVTDSDADFCAGTDVTGTSIIAIPNGTTVYCATLTQESAIGQVRFDSADGTGVVNVGHGLTGGTLVCGTLNLKSSAQGVYFFTASLGGGDSTGKIIKQGSAWLRLDKPGLWTGDTVITAGSIRCGAANVIPYGSGKGNVTVTSPGVFDLYLNSQTINGLSGDGTIDTTRNSVSVVLSVGDNNQSSSFSGTIKTPTGTSSTLTLSKIGSGILTLAGANSYNGKTYLGASVFGGTLQISQEGNLGTPSASRVDNVFINNGTTLKTTATFSIDDAYRLIQLGGSGTGAGVLAPDSGSTLTVANVISGADANSGLDMDGAGTLILSAVNTYSGLTRVKQGTLLVNSPGSLAAGSAVSVGTGGTAATLGGNGTINGTVTVGANGTLAPGTSIGTLTLGGNLTFSASSIPEFEVSTTYNGANDKVTVGGTLTCGSAQVAIDRADTAALDTSHPYVLFDASAGSISGSFNTAPAWPGSTPANSARFAIYSVGNTIVLGADTQLAFSTQPANTPAGATMASVVVQLKDGDGNPVPLSGVSVTLTVNNGTLYSGTLTKATDANGQATFNDLVFRAAGTGIYFGAAATDLTGVNSSTFNITAGTATKLQVLMPGETAAPGTTAGKTGSPTAQTAGTAFNVVVNGVDDYWNVNSAAAATVALSSSDPTAMLPAPTALVSGTVTLSVDLRGAGSRTVTASDTDGTPLTANTGTATQVNPAAASSLMFTLQPVNTTAGETMPSVEVRITDPYEPRHVKRFFGYTPASRYDCY